MTCDYLIKKDKRHAHRDREKNPGDGENQNAGRQH